MNKKQGKQKKMTQEDRARREARRLRRGRPRFQYEELDILGHVIRERRIKEDDHGTEVHRDHG